MSVVDLHPEDLLDRDARGTLTDAERARLDAHVATCAVCRFELMARDDFAALAESRSAASRFDAGRPAPTPEVAPARVRPSDRSRRRALVFGVAAALIGGMSFAALSGGLAGFSRQTTPSKQAIAGSRELARASVERDVPAVGTATPPTTTPPPDRERSVTDPSSGAPRAEKEPTPSRAHTAHTAPELFRAANGARRLHETERAIALYRELQSRYPRSEEARVSYATLATLLLDQGDARAALDGFDRYVSRGGNALSEEALVGRALSYQKLAAASSEVAAWQEVLRRFPGSVHAPVARARLAALGQQ